MAVAFLKHSPALQKPSPHYSLQFGVRTEPPHGQGACACFKMSAPHSASAAPASGEESVGVYDLFLALRSALDAQKQEQEERSRRSLHDWHPAACYAGHTSVAAAAPSPFAATAVSYGLHDEGPLCVDPGGGAPPPPPGAWSTPTPPDAVTSALAEAGNVVARFTSGTSVPRDNFLDALRLLHAVAAATPVR